MFGPHFNIVFFGGGGGGSILSESGFIGKYSKIKHTTCNIFVQDCCLVLLQCGSLAFDGQDVK